MNPTTLATELAQTGLAQVAPMDRYVYVFAAYGGVLFLILGYTVYLAARVRRLEEPTDRPASR